MKIDINKDFSEAFPEETFGGFTMKQCVVAVVGLLAAGATALSLWHFLGMDIVECTYIAVPVMIPICALGFFEYQKQTPVQLIRALYYTRKVGRLGYEAGEMPEGENRIYTMYREAFPAKNKMKWKKSKNKKGDK